MSDFNVSRAQFLANAEETFLQRCGWVAVETEEGTLWREPAAAGVAIPRELERTHAVNSELLHGPRRSTNTPAAVTDLINAQEVYLVQAGWTLSRTKTGGVSAKSPTPPKRIYSFTRAVNRQKFFDAQTRKAERKAAQEAQAEAAPSTEAAPDAPTT